MKIFDRIFNSLGYIKQDKKGRSFVLDTTSFYGGLGKPTQQNFKTYLQQYADVGWVYACVYRIASKASGVDWKIYRKSKKGEKISYDEVSDNPIIDLLTTVNPFMSGGDLIEITFAYLELTGNAYWLLDMFKGSKPTEIYPLNPHRVKIKPHPTNFIEAYLYDIGGGEYITYPPEIILHFKYFNPLDDFYGLSPLSAGRLAVDTQHYGDEYNKNFFLNSAEPKGVLTATSPLGDDQRNRLIEAWRSMHQGVRNAHKTALFEGVKWESTGLTQKDMEFVNSKKLTREDILGVFGIPPAMVGIFEYANYANSKEQREIFWRDTMIPKFKKYESIVNSFLVNIFDKNLYYEFNVEGVEALKEDEKVKAETDKILVDTGIKTINEAREERGMKPVAWGNTWNAPMNLMPITSPKPTETETEEAKNIILPVEHKKNNFIEDRKKNEKFETTNSKPYPNEHACRINPPDKYDRFARQNCGVKSDGKCIDVIYGVKEGKSEIQAYRYKKDIWQESSARSHCKGHDGTFEPASKREEETSKNNPEDIAKEIRDKIWTEFKGFTEQWERKFKPILRGLFEEQEKETRSNLEKYGLEKLYQEVRLIDKQNINQRIDRVLFSLRNANKEFRKKTKPFLREVLKAKALSELSRLGLEATFNVNNPAVIAWLDEKVFKLAGEVNTYTLDVLRANLRQAIEAGESIPMVSDRISHIFDMAKGYRTERIARTEVISASNNGSMQAYKQSGVVEKKEWISSRDADVRDTHQIDGQVRKLDTPFSNGLMYPGDPAGGPGEVINCRCTMSGKIEK